MFKRIPAPYSGVRRAWVTHGRYVACEGWGAWSVVIELASFTRRGGHDADRCKRAIAAPFVYNRGLLTVVEASHTRIKSKWTRTRKFALIRTISAPSRKTRS